MSDGGLLFVLGALLGVIVLLGLIVACRTRARDERTRR
jgi:hypothetical protein